MAIFTSRSRSVSKSVSKRTKVSTEGKLMLTSGAHQRPTTPSPSNPALLAASQAFATTPAGQKKLAQGAAAAALRSMSPVSTPVGQIQTRRMLERQNSVGALPSAQRGRARGNNMIRRSSSASMTERTFREPSPGRPATSSGLPAPRKEEPPVPRVPDTYGNIPPVPKRSHRRSASIDDIQMRRLNAMGYSQNRNFVTDASTSRPAAPNPASAAAQRVTRIQPSTPQPTLTLKRTDSNSSVNFSYPGRSRPISPPPQKQMFDSPMREVAPTKPSHPTTSAQSISQTEARNIQRDLLQVAQHPVKRRKKRDGPLTEGSHFQAGTQGAKPKITPLSPGPPALDRVDQPPEPDRVQSKGRLTGQTSHFPQGPGSATDTSQASDSDSATELVKARRALRASGALQKQPSIVKEDWEGEQKELPSSPIDPVQQPRVTSRRRQAPEANQARKIESSSAISQPQRDQPAAIAHPQNLATPEQRNSSLSPSRSTRFSKRLSSDLTQGQKHNPPLRSVSPRKPALKHSSSTHLHPADPARDSSLSPSEGTDVSFDGKPRRVKKSAHVKFDSQPAVVGIAAEPDPDLVASPQVASPQYRGKHKKWYGMANRPQGRLILSDDSDDDDAMGPRPQLPTFGSVRNSRRNDHNPPPSQQTISSPSSSSSSVSSATEPTTLDTSISSDHAIGGVIARDFEDKTRAANTDHVPRRSTTKSSQPTPSVQRTLARDSGVFNKTLPLTTTSLQRSSPIGRQRNDAELPSIAVQPATPGTEDELKYKDQWLVDVPGSFPSAQTGVFPSADPPSAESTQHYTNGHVTIAATPFSPDDNDDTPDGDRMPTIHGEGSDKDSIYSDAAEDLSDLEGDGFGSIAAIVHSPIASPEPSPLEYDRSARRAPQRNVVEESQYRDDGWDNAGARWKGLAENAKRSSLQPAAPIVEKPTKQSRNSRVVMADIESPPVSTESSPSTPNKTVAYHAVTTNTGNETPQPILRKSMRATTPEITASNTLRNSKLTDSGEFTARAVRNSMRSKSGSVSRDEAPKTMRSSMRDSINTARVDGPKPMRSSMRGLSVGARDDVQKPSRPSIPARSSSGANAAAVLAAKPHGRATLQKRNPPPGVAAVTRSALPPVRDDSDSDSSFRKRRRAKANDPGRYSMRRSMRVEPSPAPAGVERRAVRSLSPVRRRPFSPVNDQPTMRTTMRGSTGSYEVPTLRSQGSAQRSSSLFGRRNDAKSPARSMSLRANSSSRVDDSEDDRRNRPTVYKSSFQDSDNEDDESDFRPVRGIPRNTKDDDSTDLEDSSDEEKNGKQSVQKNPSWIAPTSTNAPVDEQASSDSKKKRGFFGRLRKSKDDTASSSRKDSEALVNGSEEQFEGKQSASSAALGFSTDAEKEALIEETRKRLEAARENPLSPEVEQPSQRRALRRQKSDSWPLPPKNLGNEDDRPYTADGDDSHATLEGNPSSGTPSSPGGSSLGRTGRKKRFPLLRKAFRLKD